MLVYVLDWIHVLAGALWIGGAFLAGLVVGPAIGASRPSTQGDFATQFAARAVPYFYGAGIVAIIAGVGVTSLEHAWGTAAIVGLALALVLLAYGTFVSAPDVRRLRDASEAERPAVLGRVIRSTMVELGLFLLLLTSMVVLRYAAA